MNTYERLLSSLGEEFKRKAPARFRSLWADLMEMEEAPDDQAFSEARDQALRRIYALECAAVAIGARLVPPFSRSLELKLRSLTRAHATFHPESLAVIHQAMNHLAEALYAFDVLPLVLENTNQPTETLLIESCAD